MKFFNKMPLAFIFASFLLLSGGAEHTDDSVGPPDDFFSTEVKYYSNLLEELNPLAEKDKASKFNTNSHYFCWLWMPAKLEEELKQADRWVVLYGVYWMSYPGALVILLEEDTGTATVYQISLKKGGEDPVYKIDNEAFFENNGAIIDLWADIKTLVSDFGTDIHGFDGYESAHWMFNYLTIKDGNSFYRYSVENPSLPMEDSVCTTVILVPREDDPEKFDIGSGEPHECSFSYNFPDQFHSISLLISKIEKFGPQY